MRHVADVHAVREGRAVGRVMLQANTLVVSCDICDRLHHLDLHVLPLGRIELIDVPLPLPGSTYYAARTWSSQLRAATMLPAASTWTYKLCLPTVSGNTLLRSLLRHLLNLLSFAERPSSNGRFSSPSHVPVLELFWRRVQRRWGQVISIEPGVVLKRRASSVITRTVIDDFVGDWPVFVGNC